MFIREAVFAATFIQGAQQKTLKLEPVSSDTFPQGRWNVYLGRATWPSVGRAAEVAVMASILVPSEVRSFMSELQSIPDFDEDLDSVDGLPTFEFYLEANGSTGESLSRVEGKPDADPDVMAARKASRARLLELTAPVVLERILPFVNKHYSDACHGNCRVCHSLVRRYLEGERRGHATHFDIQALATVVVGLNAFGSDFEGGLFISTGVKRRFVPLGAGDAAIHQSDLLHGVEVSKGSRWTWILWIQDAYTCDANPIRWHLAAAEAGDPVAQFLTASRLGVGKEKERVEWLRKSAEQGFPRASSELGLAYRDGQGVPVDVKEAQRWLELGVKASEPDAIYNRGLLHLDAGEIKNAVRLFNKAARAGSSGGAENLGIAYLKGAVGGSPRLEEAAKWFEIAGTPKALWSRAIVAQQLGNTPDSDAVTIWVEKAARAGHAQACDYYQRSPRAKRRFVIGCLSKQADPERQLALAKLLMQTGEAHNNVQAMQALRRAAAGGLHEAGRLLTAFAAERVLEL